MGSTQHRLRVHATQEWHDLYQKETNDELQRFFDRYTKDIDNGREETPRVRISVYHYNKVGLYISPSLCVHAQPKHRFSCA